LDYDNQGNFTGCHASLGEITKVSKK